MYLLACTINFLPHLISVSNDKNKLELLKERFMIEKHLWPIKFKKLKDDDIYIMKYDISIYNNNPIKLIPGDSVYVVSDIYASMGDRYENPVKIFATFVDYEDWRINIMSSRDKGIKFMKDEVDKKFKEDNCTWLQVNAISYEGIQYSRHQICDMISPGDKYNDNNNDKDDKDDDDNDNDQINNYDNE